MIESRQLFNNDVRVTKDLALAVSLLRSREIVLIGVDEVSSSQV